MSSMGFDPGPDGFEHLLGDIEYECAMSDDAPLSNLESWIREQRSTPEEDFTKEDPNN